MRKDNHSGVERERIGATAVLAIDRPEAANAADTAVHEQLMEAIGEFSNDASLRCVVLTGAGNRYFCSGGDLKKYRALETGEALEAAFAIPRAMTDALEALPVPVIAAINGAALGGGAELAMACDIRIAATNARIGFPQSRLGLIPGWNGTERLLRVVGYGNAMKLLASGDSLSAEEAKSIGLIHAIVPEGNAVQAALVEGERYATAAPLALAAVKRALLAAHREPANVARQIANDEFTKLWLSEDHREAEAAFAEKRSPRFEGR